MDYKIENLTVIENCAARLARYNQTLANDANSIDYVIKLVNQNWQNEQGEDLASILNNLTKCVSTIENELNPTLAKYVETLNKIVLETRSNQSNQLLQ
jgi:protein-arginine kinase activator protein McsA